MVIRRPVAGAAGGPFLDSSPLAHKKMIKANSTSARTTMTADQTRLRGLTPRVVGRGSMGGGAGMRTTPSGRRDAPTWSTTSGRDTMGGRAHRAVRPMASTRFSRQLPRCSTRPQRAGTRPRKPLVPGQRVGPVRWCSVPGRPNGPVVLGVRTMTHRSRTSRRSRSHPVRSTGCVRRLDGSLEM